LKWGSADIASCLRVSRRNSLLKGASNEFNQADIPSQYHLSSATHYTWAGASHRLL
jgi:hypothetical protein